MCASAQSAQSRQFLYPLLKATSRSFYLTLRILPEPVRPQIGLAYLLARTTDTIADTQIVPVAERVAALGQLRARILGQQSGRMEFKALAQHQGSPSERAILERVEETLGLLEECVPEDRVLIREVLRIITSGQELYLTRFAGASADHLVALRTEAELDDYTYRVAGCVGEFWTRICRAHLFKAAKLDDETLQKQGVRFGKGLQLVNILRDLAADLRQGRCYLPESELRAHGLDPAELLLPENMTRLLPVCEVY